MDVVYLSDGTYLLALLKRAVVQPSDILHGHDQVPPEVGLCIPGLAHFLNYCKQNDKLESIERRAFRTVYPVLSYCKALDLRRKVKLSQRRESICRCFSEDILSPKHKLDHHVSPARDNPYNIREKNHAYLCICVYSYHGWPSTW